MNEQRWLETETSLPEELSRALREAPGEPDDTAVQGVANELGRTLGMTLPIAKLAALPSAQHAATGAVGGQATAALAAPSGLNFITGLLGGVALGVGLSGAVVYGFSEFDHPTPQAARGATPARTAPPPQTLLPLATGPGPGPAVVSPAATAPFSVGFQAKPRDVQAPLAEQDMPADSELSLLRRAQTELLVSPARALLLADEHAARFASGALEQEREVIAIDALVRLGSRREAAARAERFRQKFPSSAHERRIDALLGPTRISR